jgi:hypothetical protein
MVGDRQCEGRNRTNDGVNVDTIGRSETARVGKLRDAVDGIGN